MEDLFVPAELAATVERWDTPDGAEWLEELPDRVARLSQKWELDLDRAFDTGGAAYVAPGRRDGKQVVLKITIPHREATHEGAALRFWSGEGAVLLLEEDVAEHTLLLERCQPGTALGALEDEDVILEVGSDLLRRLHRPPPADHPFETLDEIAAWFSGLITERQLAFGNPVPPRLVDEAVAVLRDLPGDGYEPVVLHHDFHPGNVLAAERMPWLTIDPKPQVGDPAFDPIQLILQTGEPLKADDPVALIGERLARVSERVGVDAERVRLWGIARCVEWALWSFFKGRRDWGDEAVELADIWSQCG